MRLNNRRIGEAYRARLNLGVFKLVLDGVAATAHPYIVIAGLFTGA
jgi:hypothetical protein